jgi:hypothetical protein
MRIPLPGKGMNLGTGIVLGAAAVFLAPMVLPVVSGVIKSLTKAGIKGGLIMYERGKVAIAEAQESIEDLAAEAKAEMAQEQKMSVAAPKKKAAAKSK